MFGVVFGGIWRSRISTFQLLTSWQDSLQPSKQYLLTARMKIGKHRLVFITGIVAWHVYTNEKHLALAIDAASR